MSARSGRPVLQHRIGPERLQFRRNVAAVDDSDRVWL
jgi:hypothetical protein